ncbi:MAG: ATP phosphoribosyltransferase regulatory subunit, partial [Planctomycetota bacterium]
VGLARLDGPLLAPAKALLALFDAAAHGPAAAHLVFDPTLARGLGYYTGPIFEITCAGLAGSLGGGGRYDGLIGMFKKQQVPAVGFSLGLERVLLVMEERGMFPPLGTGPQVLLCRMADVAPGAAIRIATVLRAQGLRVEVFADTPAMGKMLAYANALGAPFAAIVGSAEVAAGTVALKDLQKGEQVAVPVGDVARHVAQRS